MDVVMHDGTVVVVKERPWWLFWLLPGFRITLSPYVYVPKEVLSSPVDLMDTCVHEQVHLQQQSTGKWKFYMRYIFSRKFRYASELAAYTTEFQHYIDQRRDGNIRQLIEQAATNLSSFPYLWCVKKESAIADFNTHLKFRTSQGGITTKEVQHEPTD